MRSSTVRRTDARPSRRFSILRRATSSTARLALLLLPSLFGFACGGGGPELVAKSMPSGGNFTGVYFSPQYGEMNIIQNGSAAIGDYKLEMRSGRLQGEVTGDLMKFEWVEQKAMVSNRAQESRGHGYFRYEVDKANGDHVLKGEWGLGDAATGGGPWNAYKAKGKEPHLSKEATSGGENKGSGDEGGDSSESTPAESGSSDDLF